MTEGALTRLLTECPEPILVDGMLYMPTIIELPVEEMLEDMKEGINVTHPCRWEQTFHPECAPDLVFRGSFEFDIVDERPDSSG